MLINLRQFIAVLFVCLITAVMCSAQRGPDPASLETRLRLSFGPNVEPARNFNPSYFVGDFNGDGAQDSLSIVWIKGRFSELPKDVKTLNPFSYERRPKLPADPLNEPRLAIAILHGSNATTAPAQKFLLVGDSPVLILETSRANGRVEDRKDLMEFVKKNGRRSRTAMAAPRTARGDAVSLGTEAADSVLYWDGKTYRWLESEGGE
jgi:hypothetical protein